MLFQALRTFEVGTSSQGCFEGRFYRVKSPRTRRMLQGAIRHGWAIVVEDTGQTFRNLDPIIHRTFKVAKNHFEPPEKPTQWERLEKLPW